MEDLHHDRTVNTIEPIQLFVISSKDDLLCVLLSNNKFAFYQISTGNEVNWSGSVQYYPFQIAFIHLGALWLGNVFSPNQLNFHIQLFNDLSHIEYSFKLDQANRGYQLVSSYAVNKGSLVCALSHPNGNNCLLVYTLMDSLEMELRKVHATGKVGFVQCNQDNSFILFATEDNQLCLIDNDEILSTQMNAIYTIKSICFDSKQLTYFFVSTGTLTHCYQYLPESKTIVHLESIRNPYNSSLVGVTSPAAYLVVDGKINVHQLEELNLFQKESIVQLLSLDYKKFVSQLYTIQLEEKKLWLTLSKRCFRESDIESGIFCVSKSENPGLVRYLKKEIKFCGKSTALSLLAMNLGLIEEAEHLLKSSGDIGRLCKFYQLQNRWSDAFTNADKIKIKSAYYDYAKHLESNNKILEAIKYYEMSNNIMEIPRMLFEAGNITSLREYCLKDNKRCLVSWWGQYCESQEANNEALEMYKACGDYYNLVRLLCHIGKVDSASMLMNEYLGDSNTIEKAENHDITAALLYLGKHLEAVNSTESINYYIQCKAFRHAIRVCVANELWDELIAISVDYCSDSLARNILDNHFRGHDDKLVSKESLVKLYYKCGDTQEAIRFSIKHQLWDELRSVCHKQLSQENPKCTISEDDIDLVLQQLRQNSDIIDILIDLVIISSEGNLDLITNVIQNYGINLDEGIMNKLEKFTSSQKDATLISTFAELCLEKGNYQLAAKLYNKIGMRLESVKALIRSGNVDKVIQFANVARDKTVFKMAANFLQTINYEDTSLIMKFYVKAEAHQELERFKNALTSISQS